MSFKEGGTSAHLGSLSELHWSRLIKPYFPMRALADNHCR